MNVPDLVRQSLGDEEITAGVSLGDEDAACFTPTRTLVYRGEGLLSDEGVSEYPHDFERLTVSEGRRKTKFTMTYVDRKESFSVPANRTDPVLERLVEGKLRVDDVLAADESVTGVFRFSELTLVVAQQRLLKHVGEHTWDGDFEVYPFDDVTGLAFEDGSVATAVVLEAGGRPERIKAPNEQAGVVRQTLEEVLFEYYDVGSLEALNRTIAVDDPDADDLDADDADGTGGLGLESGIDPLVSDSSAEAGEDGPSEGGSTDAAAPTGAATGTASDDPGDETDGSVQYAASTVDVGDAADAAADTAERAAASGGELEAVTDQLADLTAAVEQQNELLKQQQRTVKQLIEELRRGR